MPFDMAVLNDLDRFHLVMERIRISNGIFPAVRLRQRPLSPPPKWLVLYLYIYASV
jgi:hypothetical protein